MTVTVQDHIHLDIYDETGVRYDLDGGPLMRWNATQRAQVPSTQLSVTRSVTGTTHVTRVVDPATGFPIQHTDWRFSLRVSEDEWQQLRSLNGKLCHFIDNRHVPDGEDHEPYLKLVTVDQVSDIQNLEPLLRKYNVTVQLTDMEGHGYDTL